MELVSVRFFTNEGGDGCLILHTDGPIDQSSIVLGSIPVRTVRRRQNGG